MKIWLRKIARDINAVTFLLLERYVHGVFCSLKLAPIFQLAGITSACNCQGPFSGIALYFQINPERELFPRRGARRVPSITSPSPWKGYVLTQRKEIDHISLESRACTDISATSVLVISFTLIRSYLIQTVNPAGSTGDLECFVVCRSYT